MPLLLHRQYEGAELMVAAGPYRNPSQGAEGSPTKDVTEVKERRLPETFSGVK